MPTVRLPQNGLEALSRTKYPSHISVAARKDSGCSVKNATVPLPRQAAWACHAGGGTRRVSPIAGYASMRPEDCEALLNIDQVVAGIMQRMFEEEANAAP